MIGSAIVMLLLAGSHPVVADDDFGDGSQKPGDTPVSGNTDGNGNLSATAGAVVFDRSKNGSGSSTGAVTSSSGNWTPPACYYAPKYTPDQLQKYLEPIWNAESTGPQWDAEQRDKYVNGGEAKDFNKAKTGKGYWWDSYVTKGREGDPGALKCTKGIFWVDTGTPPPHGCPGSDHA